MRDFTIEIYKKLLIALKDADYQFISFEDYCRGSINSDKWIILRHDVDDRKLHSLAFAQIQNELGIKGVYYFRMVPESFDSKMIKEIYDLGHEVGYHYEDMDFAKGDKAKAINFFEKHLKQLREFVPINTLCMHGSPRSKYDNKDVWQDYSYFDYGLIGEPYYDTDFNQVYYLTDTGMMWDGNKYSVRDKVATSAQWPVYHSTQDIITAVKEGVFPKYCMMNYHPQRWTDDLKLWYKEKAFQSIKNHVKRLVNLFRQ